jgi:hypothetical protein
VRRQLPTLNAAKEKDRESEQVMPPNGP